MTREPCPRCGAPLADDGQCPRCLLRLGLQLPPRDATAEGEPAAPAPAAPRRPEPLPLDEVARRFPHLEIVALVGQGGMGVVYHARQPKLGRDVALKLLPPELSADRGFAERFLREARAMARLSHPHVVAVHDFGESDGVCWLLMEFVDGVNLRQALRAGTLTPERALAIVPQMCDALQYAHDEGVVHRDIKPENVLLDRQGRVKIADFGLAKLLGPQDVTLTGEQQVFGTPHYMAPEQLEGARDVDHRADIYSLGVVFYEMLTGRLPLGRFEPPSRRVQVDVRLDEVVLHALEQLPERRYQHAAEVGTDVQDVAAGGEPQAARAAAREGPAAPAAGVVLGLGGLTATLGVAELDADDDEPEEPETAGDRIVGHALVGAMLVSAAAALWRAIARDMRERPDSAWVWWGLLGGAALGALWQAGEALQAWRAARAARDAAPSPPPASVPRPAGLLACLLAGAGWVLANLGWTWSAHLPSMVPAGSPERGRLRLEATLWLLAGLGLLVAAVARRRARGAPSLLDARARWPEALAWPVLVAGGGCLAWGALASGYPAEMGLFLGWLLVGEALALLLLRALLRGAARPGPALEVSRSGTAGVVARVDVAAAAGRWLRRFGDSAAYRAWIPIAMLIWFATAWGLAARLTEAGVPGVALGVALLGVSCAWWLIILVKLAPELEAALRAEAPALRRLRHAAASALLVAGLLLSGVALQAGWEWGTARYASPSRSPWVVLDEDAGRLAQLLGQLDAWRDAPPGDVGVLAQAPRLHARPLDWPVLPTWIAAGCCLYLAFVVAAWRPEFARRWRAGWAPAVLGPACLLGGLAFAEGWRGAWQRGGEWPPLTPVRGSEVLRAGWQEVRAELAESLQREGYSPWVEREAELQAPGGAATAREWALAAEPSDLLGRWDAGAEVGPDRLRPQLVLRLLAVPGATGCVLAWDAGHVREFGGELRRFEQEVERILEPLRRLQAPAAGG